MAIKRCPNGHFYDPDVNSSCPWCAVPSDGEERTRRINLGTARAVSEDSGSTIKLPQMGESSSKSAIEEGHTVAVVKRKIGIDPVVGWFVCIKGPDRGRDYRIRSEKNSIGRADSMDVCISGDDTISRVDHAFVVYDPKKRSFRIQAGLSRGLIYLNGEEVTASETLSAYDRVEMGRSEFLFIPLCGEHFQWEADQDS
ncbi:MAG: FHA domain-containing protein [Aminobacteriaceae bacterium]